MLKHKIVDIIADSRGHYDKLSEGAEQVLELVSKVLKRKLNKILTKGISLPILKLKETNPEYYFTEKGLNTLIENTTEDILKELK